MLAEDQIKDMLHQILGYSVTQRIRTIKQPWGGYIRARDMTKQSLGEGIDALNSEENVHPGLVGLAVEYLTRFLMGSLVENAFRISLMGAKVISKETEAKRLARKIQGLDEQSVINAVKMCGYDVCFRSSVREYVPVKMIKPDKKTVENIITMVHRSENFFSIYGPVVMDGLTFEGGYTNTVTAGDGDFLTKDTLWDFKVLRNTINKNHTLQLLMYWRMGVHSKHPEYRKVRYLGIFNPRLNIVYRIAVSKIQFRTIKTVEKDVIGYSKKRLSSKVFYRRKAEINRIVALNKNHI